jgi:methyl-accepting chemotaxis protein
LREPGALDRRWFDTHALNRTITRLAALHGGQPAAELKDAGAHLREQSSRFVNLLCDGQLEQATQLSQQLESEHEALLKQLAALLVDA